MMQPRSRVFSAFPVLLTLLAVQTGCAASSHAPSAPMSAKAGYPAPSSEMASPAPAPPPAPAAEPSAPGAAAPAQMGAAHAPSSTTPPKPADTKSAKNAGPSTRAPVIIYQGDLRMMADEDAIPKTIDKVIDVAESVGGHIAGRKDQSVQIKVPSASFREAMTKIEAIGGVVGRAVTADDVSEEFHDLEVRLGNLRATRARLQDFLAKANGIQDMLTVERELERVALEIDRMEGRLEFLLTRASMSVISVALTAKPKVVPIVVTTPPTPPRAGIDLPIPWVGQVGIDPLLSLRK
jgi:hypothetical protein